MDARKRLLVATLGVAGVVLVWVAWIRWHDSGRSALRVDATADSGAPETSAYRTPTGAASGDSGIARVEVPKPAAPAQQSVIEVRVRDQRSRPIRGAQLLAFSGSPSALGVTDNSGNARVLIRLGLGESLARADGYADTGFDLGDCPGGVVEIVMPDEAQISGRIVGPAGNALEGMRLVAWPATASLDHGCMLAELQVAGDPRANGTSSLADGSFVLRRLNRGSAYRIAAGGLGMVVADAKDTYPCPREGLELRALPAYGAIVCATDATGSLIPCDERLDPAAYLGMSSGCEVEGAAPISAGASAVLAGIPRSQLTQPAGAYLWLFAWNREATALQPVNCEARIPGYELNSTDLSLPRIGGELAIEKLALVPIREGVGELVVQFVSADQGTPLAVTPPGTLLLQSVGHEELRYVIRAGGSPNQIFKIPRGEYFCAFRSRAGPFSYPPLGSPGVTAQVGARSATFLVRMPPVGSIEIVMEDDPEARTRHRLSCYLGDAVEADPQGGAAVRSAALLTLDGPPFRITGIPEGLYSIYIFQSGQRSKTPELVDVRGGETTRCVAKVIAR